MFPIPFTIGTGAMPFMTTFEGIFYKKSAITKMITTKIHVEHWTEVHPSL